MSDNTPTCSVEGCVREAVNTYKRTDRAYCDECLNRMQHWALDLAGVP